jgi:hypothetical protein
MAVQNLGTNYPFLINPVIIPNYNNVYGFNNSNQVLLQPGGSGADPIGANLTTNSFYDFN